MKQLFNNAQICLLSLLLIIGSHANAEELSITLTYLDEAIDESLSVSEAVGTVKLTATLSQVQTHDIHFAFKYTGLGSASIHSDFTFQGVTLLNKDNQYNKEASIKIPKGESSVEFPLVRIQNDALYENLNAFNVKHNLLDQVYETLVFTFAAQDGSGLDLSHRTLTLKIEDDDALPTIALSSSEFFPLARNNDGSYSVTMNESDGGIPLTLSLRNTTSNYPLQVGYIFTQNIGANGDTEEPDYLDPGENMDPPTPGYFTIPATSLSKNFTLMIEDDVLREETEVITFTLSNPINALIHPDRNSISLTIEDNDASTGIINDTGVTACYNHQADIIEDCANKSDVLFLNQDGSESTPNQFVRLDENGYRVEQAEDEAVCIYDENTHLIWENRNMPYLFSWYNTKGNVNGGNAGFQGSSGTTASKCGPQKLCNTDRYRSVLNKLTSQTDETVSGLCNVQNWRLPKLSELISIMDFEPNNSDTLVDTTYFKSQADTYWTSTPVAISPEHAWCVNFGIESMDNKHIRQCEKISIKGRPARMVAACNPDNSSPDRPC